MRLELPKALAVKHVRELFQRLERRDKRVYLHKFGASRNSPFLVCSDDLLLLDPWEPSSLQELLDRVKALQAEKVELKKRIERLERFASDTQHFLNKGRPR